MVPPGTAITISASTLDCATPNDAYTLYSGMPIGFSGDALGGIDTNIDYYVLGVANGTRFIVSETLNGPAKTLTNFGGSMIGTGQPYIQVSATQGGSAVSLTAELGPVDAVQTPQNLAEFSVSYKIGRAHV